MTSEKMAYKMAYGWRTKWSTEIDKKRSDKYIKNETAFQRRWSLLFVEFLLEIVINDKEKRKMSNSCSKKSWKLLTMNILTYIIKKMNNRLGGGTVYGTID